ncbi:carboxypeptidase-like regulatory domain-containing protein [uncultured Algibacter sp.]|uniref:carboxypeptidase-like regulatory domain-containing protein n=1 Tax=uncultured Algibacter sp. TaxID=298659 RepID=UPI00261C6C45|nr:carboxypeptidase-like regulatory domain-containing protein [uncultured Algibacter sp.]
MKLPTTLFLFTMSFVAFSQTTIKGTVSDEIALLSGTNIFIKNSKVGVVSNTEGYFEIQAKIDDTLLVSYLGYNTKEIVIDNEKQIHLKLEGSIALNEVEIVAYGTTICSHVIRCYNTCKTTCGFDVTYLINNDFKSNILTEKLFPNPSKNGTFQLILLKPYRDIQVQVNGITGQLIKTFSYQNVNNKISIDLSQNPIGIYIINIIADGKRLSPKKAIRG